MGYSHISSPGRKKCETHDNSQISSFFRKTEKSEIALKSEKTDSPHRFRPGLKTTAKHKRNQW